MNVKAIAVSGLAVLVIAGGALFVAGRANAQEGDPGSGRTGLLERVAGKLGIDVDTLKGAFKDARLDAVDEALSDGRITEEQAAKARQRIEEGKRPGLRARHRVAMAARTSIVESSAGAMGMTADELRDELRAGKSIADVATERNVSIDDVKARITSDAQAKLAGLVEEGRIDQARADSAMERLNAHLDAIVNFRRG